MAKDFVNGFDHSPFLVEVRLFCVIVISSAVENFFFAYTKFTLIHDNIVQINRINLHPLIKFFLSELD